ncbi:MAG: rRNA pseudouridine synthase [Ruminococcaceae bacterium]|nr:rRNA pseudouridine synthase [Oscillospiraceae bacterium]
MRLDKFITSAGLLSRKEAGDAAKKGRITVNGVVVTNAACHIDEEQDNILLDGVPVLYRRFTYIMLNKPAGYVSATEAPGDVTVIQLLPPELQKIGLFPCGRLDKNTLGLMILTNNGPLAHRLLAPKTHCEKVYRFESRFPLSEKDCEILEQGVDLGDFVTAPCKITMESAQRGYIVLTEGKYHQIKRMLEAVHNKITYLERVSFADIVLDPALERGKWRYLTKEEQIKIEERK